MFLKKELTKIYLLILISFTYFLGFFFRENAAGGGEADFVTHTWPLINSFKKDFFYTIDNYGSFNEASYPLSHIINAYLNPFSNEVINFQFSVTLISFFVFIIFAFTIKKIFQKVSYIDIFLTSSIILILPFFRTSAFWGLTENFGWLFLISSLYFFIKIRNDIDKNLDIEHNKNIIFFCLLSSCGIYCRQTLIFLPISYLLFLLVSNADKKIFIKSIILYSIFSIPGFLLILKWGALYDVSNNSSYTTGYFSYENILKNVPIITSLFSFYFIPILFIEILSEGYKKVYQKYFKFFIIFLIFYLLLLQINLLGYLGEYDLSGGIIIKINYLIYENNFYLLLIFSSLGLSILLRLFKENSKNNLIMLLPLLIIYCFPRLLYQEYIEPLFLIIFFLCLKTDLHQIYFRKVYLSNIVMLIYFSIYLSGAVYIRHFSSIY